MLNDLPEIFARLKNGKFSWMTSLGVRLPHCKKIQNEQETSKYKKIAFLWEQRNHKNICKNQKKPIFGPQACFRNSLP
jgi:hypothetical protein